MSTSVMLDTVKAAHDAAVAKAQAAKAAFNQKREEIVASEEGLQSLLDENSPAYKALDELDTARCAADEEASRIDQRYKRLVEMDGGNRVELGTNDAPGGMLDGAAKALLAGGKQPIRAALSALANGESVQKVVNQLQRDITTGTGGVVNLGEAITRDQFMNYVGPSTAGSNPFVVPEHGPAVLPLGAARPRLQDLIAKSTIDSDTFKYPRLVGRPTDAAFVARATTVEPGAEDGLLPLGTATFELVEDRVKNLGEGIPVHATSFMDAGELMGILETLLDFDLARGLEAGIYGGDGEGENLPGITNTANIGSIAYSADYNAIEQIKRGITAIRIAGEEPGWVALHPNDDDTLAFMRDESGGAGTGSYLAGSPFSGQSQTIWGLPRVAADAVTEGLPLVGSTYGARLRVRSGVSYAVTDSHKDWFLRQVLLLRAVMRVGLGVERPKSFCEVDIAA